MILIFEGIDGSGKTTQIKLLSRELRKRKIKYYLTKEPKEPLRSVILKNKFHPLVYFFLFNADRARNFLQIKKYLKKKYWILIDRSFPSTFAYQWALGGLDKVIDKKLLLKITKISTFSLYPDKVFVFDLPAEIAYSRLKKENIFEDKGLNYFKKLRKVYLKLSKIFKWHVIDSSKSKKEVFEEIKKILKLC